ncbi:hypothetical protein NL676_001610 [Syzygium grande]|nr:hypothetical protein NL676_001610 [Syzygium grande]
MLGLWRSSLRSTKVARRIRPALGVFRAYHSTSDSVGLGVRLQSSDFTGAKSNIARSTWLMTMLGKEGRILEARKVFDEMGVRDEIAWTTLISAYIKCGFIEEARELFDRADAKRNVVTWTAMLGGYVKLGRIREAETLFDEMPHRNAVSWNTMIDGYAQNDQVDSALKLFESMPGRNVVSWNMIITALAQRGRIEEAKALFNQMPRRDVISWTAMVAGLSKSGMIDEARELFDRMPERNVVSWNAMITGYAQNKRSREALNLFERMPERDVPSWNTMITGLIHNGDIEKARDLFNEMPQRNVVSWTTMITGSWGRKASSSAYAHHGCGREAIILFNQMIELGFKPDDSSFVGLLSACSHAGLVEEGLEYFSRLVQDKSVQLKEDHFACLIDLCGRAGRLEEAFYWIEQVVDKPSACLWGALLAGCNYHGNAEIGKVAAEKLFELEPENAGTYLLLSNIYASTGKWRDAARVRLEMKEEGLKKQPGCSWIEVGNMFHVFVVADKSHCQKELIYFLLLDLHLKMKMKRSVQKDVDSADEDFLVA